MPVSAALKKYSSMELKGTNKYFGEVSAENLPKALKILAKDFDTQRINSISTVDTTQEIVMAYHITARKYLVTLKVRLPRDNPEIKTITQIFPGAALFEREAMEMMGVRILEHPTGGRLFLPDEWKEGSYPLRKDWKKASVGKQEAPVEKTGEAAAQGDKK